MNTPKVTPIRVGVAGWYYPDWRGIVYPAETQAADHLRYLAGFVDVIEINNTFYRPPEPADIDRWSREVSALPDFKFTLKLWQRFTHVKEERWEPAELRDFLSRVRPLFETGLGGAMLAQFPHSFHFNRKNAAYLDELLDRIAGIPMVVEVRHQSWDSADAFSLLRSYGAGICMIDQPLFGSSLPPVEEVTGGVGYIRLHGRNKRNWFKAKNRDERYDYLYTKEQLEPWIERTRKLAKKTQEVYVIANNHFHGQEVCNALMIKSMLLQKPVPAPAKLVESFPVLNEYVRPDAPIQEKLF